MADVSYPAVAQAEVDTRGTLREVLERMLAKYEELKPQSVKEASAQGVADLLSSITAARERLENLELALRRGMRVAGWGQVTAAVAVVRVDPTSVAPAPSPPGTH